MNKRTKVSNSVNHNKTGVYDVVIDKTKYTVCAFKEPSGEVYKQAFASKPLQTSLCKQAFANKPLHTRYMVNKVLNTKHNNTSISILLHVLKPSYTTKPERRLNVKGLV